MILYFVFWSSELLSKIRAWHYPSKQNWESEAGQVISGSQNTPMERNKMRCKNIPSLQNIPSFPMERNKWDAKIFQVPINEGAGSNRATF